MSYLAKDVEVFFPLMESPLRAEGREAAGRLFAQVFARAATQASGPPYLDLRPHDLRIRQTGDIAVVTFHLFDPGVLGRRTLVWQHEGNRWLIMHLHASNVPWPPLSGAAQA